MDMTRAGSDVEQPTQLRDHWQNYTNSGADGPCSNNQKHHLSANSYLFRPVQDVGGLLYNSVRGAMGSAFGGTGSDMNYATDSSSKPKTTVVEILPPPPPKMPERDSPTFEGPNPYALCTSSTDESSASGASEHGCIEHSFSHNAMKGGAQYDSNTLATSSSLTIASSGSAEVVDFLNIRIEKQRMCMAVPDGSIGGGSLFATSPRTFLMGGGGAGGGKGDGPDSATVPVENSAGTAITGVAW